MTLSLAVHDTNRRLSPSSHDVSPLSYQSPISPDTPDTIEKLQVPLMTDQGAEKPSMVLSTQCVDDLTEHADFQMLSKRDAKLKHRIRRFKFVLRLLTFLFAIYDLSTMTYTLNLFLRTYRIRRTLYLPPEPITRGPWHADSKNWPTFLLLVISVVSCLASFVIIALYMHSVAAANKASERLTQLAYSIFTAHVVVWIGTAIAYKKGKDGSDLWGWSCTHEARVVLQPFFKDVVDFGLLCRIQTSSWAVSVAQAALTSLNLLLLFFTFRRHRSKTGLRSMPSPTSSTGVDSGAHQDSMMTDPEKEPGVNGQKPMAGREKEEQRKYRMTGGTKQTADEEGGEEKREPEPLKKRMREQGTRGIFGYITTYVNVFN